MLARFAAGFVAGFVLWFAFHAVFWLAALWVVLF